MSGLSATAAQSKNTVSPSCLEARKTYAETLGSDGMQLLAAIYDDPKDGLWLRNIKAVEVLRQTWVHQYFVDNGQVRWREAKNLPPAGNRLDSPYDTDARYGNKRSTTWTGYKVHLTETCEKNEVHLITHVVTTKAHMSDVEQTQPIHQALTKKALLPSEHLMDAGYIDSELLINSRKRHKVELIGPVRPDSSWQGKTPGSYDLSQFKINWNTKKVTCPQGKKSINWVPALDKWGNSVIHVKFSRTTCRQCPARELCTRQKSEPRSITLRPLI